MLTKKGKITIVQEDAEEEVDEPENNNKKKKKKISKQEKIELQQPTKKPKHSQIKSLISEEDMEQELKGEEEKQVDIRSTMSHLAICFPDSILDVPQTSALRAYFISEIARIASIFKVDEIVILKDHGYTQKSQKFIPSDYIARNLQYLETPQYLRKYLFKMHPDLNNVGLMNPVEALHHFRSDEKSQFREGVALERPTKAGCGSWVDIGLRQHAKMDHLVLPLTRVTLRIKNFEEENANVFEAEAIAKSTPRQEKGIYWGYDVRIAENMKEVVKGYDVLMLCNHSRETHGLPEVKDPSVFGQQKVMVYFAGTANLDEQISRDPKPKLTFQESIQKFNYSVRLAMTGVKQLRLEERMILTLSQFAL